MSTKTKLIHWLAGLVLVLGTLALAGYLEHLDLVDVEVVKPQLGAGIK